MNEEELAILLALINTDVTNADKTDIEVAEWCNEQVIVRWRETLVTERTLMGTLGAVVADEVLTKLELAGEVIPAIARALKMMSPAQGGVDLGSDDSRGMMDYLVSVAMITPEDSALLKGMGEYYITRYQDVELESVMEGNVYQARRDHAAEAEAQLVLDEANRLQSIEQLIEAIASMEARLVELQAA